MNIKTQFALALWSMFFALPVLAERHALLIGVSNYTDERIPDLEGPKHDVATLKEVLLSRWDYQENNIRTLIDGAATEKNILSALSELNSTTKKGDQIFIYFSGHGTSAKDSQLGAKLHLPDGSGAIVASDFNPSRLKRQSMHIPNDDGLLIGRYELKARLKTLNKAREVLVVFDACFSGNSARTQHSNYTPKNKRFISLGRSPLSRSVPVATKESLEASFDYNNLVYFGAAAEDQLAVDISQAEIDAGFISTIDGKPHGGFTDSFLRVLSNERQDLSKLSYARLFSLVINQFNVHCKACGHDPVALPALSKDGTQLLDKPFFLRTRTAGTQIKDKPFYPASKNAKLRLDMDNLQNLVRHIDTSLLSVEHSQIDPDILVSRHNDRLFFKASNGRLLTTFPAGTEPSVLESWLASRQWLKKRQASDLEQESGLLRSQFRHPLRGMRVKGGEHVFFQVQVSQSASLAMFTINSQGQLSLLYPVEAAEANRIFETGDLIRIPSIQERPIKAVPPWGADVVLFYALPPKHPILQTLQSLAGTDSISFEDERLQTFENLLDSGELDYSASTITFVSEE